MGVQKNIEEVSSRNVLPTFANTCSRRRIQDICSCNVSLLICSLLFVVLFLRFAFVGFRLLFVVVSCCYSSFIVVHRCYRCFVLYFLLFLSVPKSVIVYCYVTLSQQEISPQDLHYPNIGSLQFHCISLLYVAQVSTHEFYNSADSHRQINPPQGKGHRERRIALSCYEFVWICGAVFYFFLLGEVEQQTVCEMVLQCYSLYVGCF